MKSERIDPMEFGDVLEWANSFRPPMKILDFVGAKIGLPGVLAVVAVLWPSLIEIRGCVLLSWRYEEAEFEKWWAELSGDRSAVEDLINHVHLWDVFSDLEDPLSARALAELGQIMTESWRCALRCSYPEREFIVHMDTDEDEYGPTISFRSS